MAGGFIQFILDCEKEHGGALLRQYMATSSIIEMRDFFILKKYSIPDSELKTLWDAKEGAKYICIDYEYINGVGKSY